MRNGIRKYASQIKSYLEGENKDKPNWNTLGVISITSYYLYSYDKEKLFCIPFNYRPSDLE